MSIEALRAELIDGIQKADERRLLLVKRAIEEPDDWDGYVVPQDELDEVERRRQRYLRGEGRSYSMDEAHEIIRREYREKRDAA